MWGIEREVVKDPDGNALDKVVEADDAILASNTSSIPIMKLGTATQRPEQVIGIHFFNPVPVLKLVELVTSLMTSDDTTGRSDAFATDVLGKQHGTGAGGAFGTALLGALSTKILAQKLQYGAGRIDILESDDLSV